MLPIESYLRSVKTFTPKKAHLAGISEAEINQFIEFIQIYEANDPEQIHKTVHSTASLMVLLNIFEDTMVRDYENNKASPDDLYFHILSQLFNSINDLPKIIQDELQYLLFDHVVGGIRKKAAKIVKIPLISTNNTVLIKCETKDKAQAEWAMIQKIRETCGQFIIPYYDILDCKKNLCIFCTNNANSAIVMKESGNTLAHWITNNHNDGGIYFGKLVKIILAVIDALQCLHHNGFYHGDVKPQNILVTEKEDLFRVQLIDFEKSGTLEIGKTTKAGTPEFKIHHETPVNKIDIQAIAIIVYVFLILRLPNMHEFGKLVKTKLPGTDIKNRYIFEHILSVDSSLEKLGNSPETGFLISATVVKMMEHYFSVLLGHSSYWFSKHDLKS